MQFIQLYLAANGAEDDVRLWRTAHGKEPENKDYEAVRRFLKRPEALELIGKNGELTPSEEAILRQHTEPRKIYDTEERAALLEGTYVERQQMIAYWEQVLLYGANDVFADIHSPEPKLSHLVQSYKVRETKHGEQIEITIPSKKDAASILASLKGMETIATGRDERRVRAEEAFAQSEWFRRWKEQQARQVVDAEIVEPPSSDTSDAIEKQVGGNASLAGE